MSMVPSSSNTARRGIGRLANRALHRHWCVSVSAWLVVAAMHSMLIAPFVLGSSIHKRLLPPDQLGAGATALESTTSPVEAMMLVDLSNRSSASEELLLDELASLGIELPPSSLLIAGLDALPPPTLDDAIEQEKAAEAEGDTQGHAEMFGRYVGQISARIERAWRRPRGDLVAPRFSCQAKIEQDEDGRVLSVELRHCNGDAHWQRSLVTAIEHAAPLPSPPIPSVFARTLVLDFSASPFVSGVSDASEYEPEMRLAQSDPKQVIANPGKTMDDLQGYRGHIDLRIQHGTTTWTLHDGNEASAKQATSSGCGTEC